MQFDNTGKQLEKAANDKLVAEFLANGGKIQVLPYYGPDKK